MTIKTTYWQITEAQVQDAFARFAGQPIVVHSKPELVTGIKEVDPPANFGSYDECYAFISANKQSLPAGTFVLINAKDNVFTAAYHFNGIQQHRTPEFSTPVVREIYKTAQSLGLRLCFRYAADKPATEQPGGSVCVHIEEDGDFGWKVGSVVFKSVDL